MHLGIIKCPHLYRHWLSGFSNFQIFKLTTVIKKLLETGHTKSLMLGIVDYVGKSQEKFDELISNCFGEELVLAQRASWPIRYIVEKNPILAKKHLKKMLNQLKKPGHPSIRRNFIKSMEYVDIPKSLEAQTISICFDLLNDKNEFVAIKIYSMDLLEKMCNKYPELKKELKASIESQMEFEKPGFKSRGRKILIRNK